MKPAISDDLVAVLHILCEDIETPRALTVAILLRYSEWDQLASLACDPGHYLSSAAYLRDASCTALLRKCRDLPTTFDREAEAYGNWWKGEKACYHSNERLGPYLHRNDAGQDPEIASFFSKVRKTVLDWVGPSPRSLTAMRFGPGTTFSDRGVYSTIPDKINNIPSLTRGAIWWLPQFLGSQLGSSLTVVKEQSRHRLRTSPFDFVRGNRFSTAPKDATKDRAIAAEPSMNILFQLGLGREIRESLRRNAGIDLDHGQNAQRLMAERGSSLDDLSTLDLKNASDTVSHALVKLVMPQLWFEALSGLRSPSTFFNVKGLHQGWVHLEKFSSMGNGYTFELETLIFAALAKTAIECCGGTIDTPRNYSLYGDYRFHRSFGVYGDDIIVPKEYTRAVTAVLAFCGLQLNPTKSFSEGNFRESCGGDYFSGCPVRPHYAKKDPKSPQDWFALANGLFRLGSCSPDARRFVRRARNFCVSRIPSGLRGCVGPSELGDIVLHDDPGRWRYKWRHSKRYFRVYHPVEHCKVPYSGFPAEVVLACATYGVGWGEGGVTPRDSVLSYGLGWVTFS